MTLLHPALLLGLLLAAIPVVLHLLLRAKPKRLVFPALRLLQQRRIQNSRRMRLRQFWLMLLRVLLIAGLVLAVARPTLPPANYALTFPETLVLGALLACAIAVTLSLQHWWRRRAVSPTILEARTTYLRGGVGLATLVLCLLLVGWPYQRRIAAEITAPAPATIDNLPVAAVFVCDTSLSMAYQLGGERRLDTARSIVVDHLEHLPPGSTAGVLLADEDVPVVLSPDLVAVQNRLASLQLQTTSLRLNEQLRAAIQFQIDDRRRQLGAQTDVPESSRRDAMLREIYLLTDLARSAWTMDQSQSLATILKEHEWLSVYIIDVGVERPTNMGLTDIRLSSPTLRVGGSASLTAALRAQGSSAADAIVEFWVGDGATEPVKRDQQSVRLARDAAAAPDTDASAISAAAVEFQVQQATGTLLQGVLKIGSTDPWPYDDSAYLTLRVQEPLGVTVVAPDRATAGFFLEALAGLSTGGTSYRAQFVPVSDLAQTDLSQTSIVCLLNVPALSDPDWNRLHKFCSDGGGLLVCLGAFSSAGRSDGSGIDPSSYASEAAQTVLSFVPRASLKFSPVEHLDLRSVSHPFAERLKTLGVVTSLADVDFRRYWSGEGHANAITLGRWTGQAESPALTLREIGRGRTLLFASSVDSTAWSDWPRDWTFLAMIDEWLQLLSRQSQMPSLFVVGDPVEIPWEPSDPPRQYLLRQPGLTQSRLDVASDARELVLTDLRELGNYQIVEPGPQARVRSGFSLNLIAAEGDFTRLTAEELDQLLGEGRYGLARDVGQLERTVRSGRMGQEVSGLLLALLAGIFVLEQMAATYFYRPETTGPAPVARGT